MNEFHSLKEQQVAVAQIMEVYSIKMVYKGYNPITGLYYL